MSRLPGAMRKEQIVPAGGLQAGGDQRRDAGDKAIHQDRHPCRRRVEIRAGQRGDFESPQTAQNFPGRIQRPGVKRKGPGDHLSLVTDARRVQAGAGAGQRLRR